jgi:hypothetical protein
VALEILEAEPVEGYSIENARLDEQYCNEESFDRLFQSEALRTGQKKRVYEMPPCFFFVLVVLQPASQTEGNLGSSYEPFVKIPLLSKLPPDNSFHSPGYPTGEKVLFRYESPMGASGVKLFQEEAQVFVESLQFDHLVYLVVLDFD